MREKDHKKIGAKELPEFYQHNPAFKQISVPIKNQGYRI
jgi:hypothetical protein